MPTATEELRRQVAEINWYHRIDLGDGIVTPGYDPTEARLAALQMPESLEGLEVLDIGAWDGFYSFEAERRGASRVVALDSYMWSISTGRKGFDLAHRVFDSRVEPVTMEMVDISPETVGTFDVVFFLGVLYHLRHPLLALEKIASVTKQLLLIETHVDLLNVSRPAAAFYPGGELGGDESNWWGPNVPACEALLRSAGFSDVRTVTSPVSSPRRLAAAVKRRDPKVLRYGRAVFHARP